METGICVVCGHKLNPAPNPEADMQCSNPECPGKGQRPAELAFYSTRDLIDELRSRSTVFFCCMRPKVRNGFDWVRSFGGRLDRVVFLIELAKLAMMSEAVTPGQPAKEDGAGEDDLGQDYDDTDESVDLGPDED